LDISEFTAKASPDQTKKALEEFLTAYMNPSFGTLPKTELELIVLRLLAQIGAVLERPTVYELISGLKVTRSKARRLIYEQELRTRTPKELDEDIRRILRRPILQKRGDSFALEIENPLLSDHIRAKLKTLGHVTDGSFSASLITLTVDAMVALIEGQLSAPQKSEALDALIAAGAPEKTINGVLKSALKKLGAKIADETGQAVAEDVAKYIGPLLDASKAAITDAFSSVFTGGAN
jgi:hypothetical protein